MKKGDYVLATKFSDGDPHDHFAVGLFSHMLHERFIVVDDKGTPFLASGFRRAAKISPECGSFIVDNIHQIECMGRSLWSIKRFWKSMLKMPR